MEVQNSVGIDPEKRNNRLPNPSIPSFHHLVHIHPLCYAAGSRFAFRPTCPDPTYTAVPHLWLVFPRLSESSQNTRPHHRHSPVTVFHNVHCPTAIRTVLLVPAFQHCTLRFALCSQLRVSGPKEKLSRETGLLFHRLCVSRKL